MALYHKYRPTTFDEVVGNEQVIASLKAEMQKETPAHAYLLYGPTGCGKTTLGRIIAKELGCHEDDFTEVDSADFRGIDTVREMRRQSQFQPMSGKCRVWLLDECFAKGTKILMANGKSKNIETIQVGDTVQNLVGTGEVVRTFQNKVALEKVVRLQFNNGTSCICSSDHLFYTDRGWVEAKALTFSDLLFTPSCDTMQDTNTSQRSEINGTDMFVLRQTVAKRFNKVLQSAMQSRTYTSNDKERNKNMPYLQQRIHCAVVFRKENLFKGMWQYISRTKTSRTQMERGIDSKIESIKKTCKTKRPTQVSTNNSTKFRTYEEKQPYALHQECEKNVEYSQNQWYATCMGRRKRRKWQVHTCSSITSNIIRVGNGSCDSYEIEKPIPNLLQSRCRQSGFETCNRSRWRYAQIDKDKKIGQEKRRQVSRIRVESITFYKRRSNDQSFASVIGDKERNQGYVILHDFEVDTDHSYVANGVFVHNCHQNSRDAQHALLKALEDAPSHVKYILATTDPQKLLPTIRGRCAQYQVNQLTNKEMLILLRRIVKAEGEKLTKEVYEHIIESGQGHPRNTLQILDQVLNVEEDMRLEIAKQAIELETDAIELCRALMQRAGWKKVASILNKIKDQDPESVRRLVLSYCNSILLKGENMTAGLVMEHFIEPFYNTGFPGLTFACFSIVCGEE